MTGALIGLVGGIGLFLIWSSIVGLAVLPPRKKRRSARAEMLADAGLLHISSTHLWLIQVTVAVISSVLLVLLTQSAVIAAMFGTFGFFVPPALVRRLRDRRRHEMRDVWPEAIDHLTSAVRAGLSIAESLGTLAIRGPEPLREPFARFAADYRASGRFADCLDALKARLADPVGDRVCETLRVSREVGGRDLGTVLRTLSAFLREENRVRAEMESRKQTSINGARLAVAAPWLVLILLATQSTTLAAYDTPAGLLVLLVGAAVCAVAYRLMLQIGKLPEEQRVLR